MGCHGYGVYVLFFFILIQLDDPVILVYYTSFYILSLICVTPKPLKNMKNRLKLTVFLLSWLQILFLILFFIHPDRAWLSDHFGVLHDLLYALPDPWDTKNPQKWGEMVAMLTLVTMVTVVTMATKLMFFKWVKVVVPSNILRNAVCSVVLTMLWV